MITPAGFVSTTAGQNAKMAMQTDPAWDLQGFLLEDIAIDPDGNIFVSDAGNHKIKKSLLTEP
ncbi:MAG: hypothetical protein R3C61_01310 [Bacteroidia bacterium]